MQIHGDVDAYYNLGVAYAEKHQRYEDAREAWHQALQLEPDDRDIADALESITDK